MAKNSEVYKTTQERAEAFRAFCDANSESHHGCGCVGCPLQPTNNCHFAWLDLEAEEENQPLPCPFCGAPVEFDDNCNVFNCTSCNYMSSGPLMNESSIAAHNRVAKKCREAQE